MKKLICTTIVFLLLVSASSGVRGETKEPSYSSEKPLYAFVVLNEEATKVLEFVFDESEGTGKAYDTVYADLNLNGDLTDDKPIKATLVRQSPTVIRCSFPPIAVPVPYNEKGKGIEKPWQIILTYYQFARRPRGKEESPSIGRRYYHTEAKTRLRDDTGEWEYSFFAELHPLEEPEGALAAAFGGNPILMLKAKPDKEKKGNTGIAANLRAEGTSFKCSKDNQPTTAHVQIKNEDGKIVLDEDVSSDKLSFG